MAGIHSQQFVVDADSHVLEPPDLWNNYLESRYRDRGIRFRRNSDNLEELVVDQEVLMAGGLAGLSMWLMNCFSTPIRPMLKAVRKPVLTLMRA